MASSPILAPTHQRLRMSAKPRPSLSLRALAKEKSMTVIAPAAMSLRLIESGNSKPSGTDVPLVIGPYGARSHEEDGGAVCSVHHPAPP
jgi:hypothetical protein